MKSVLTALVMLTSFAAFAADATMQGDDTAINSACTSDASTASCSGDTAGKGLIKCLMKYKKANPSYKFSPSCQAALKQHRSDKQAGK